MATIYISTDKYLDEVTYASGDTLRVTEGATLTMVESNTVYPSYIYIDYGTFHIDGTSAASPIVLTMNIAGNVISCSSLGIFRVTGAWNSLGTGDGSAGQTFTFYHTHHFPFVQVETSAGSGEYITCLNMWATPFNKVGPGTHLGCFFQFSETTSTITFGDGTDGMLVPNGSNVRVPNVFITGNIAYSTSTASRVALYNNGSATIDMSVCMMSSRTYFLSNSFAYGLSLNAVGTTSYTRINQCFNASIDGLYIMPDCGGNSDNGLLLNNFYFDVNDIIIATYYIVASALTGQNNTTYTNSKFYTLNNNAGTGYSCWVTAPTLRTNFVDCLFAGGKLRVSASHSALTDCLFSRTMDGVLSTTSTENIYLENAGVVEISNAGVCPNGTLPYNTFISAIGIDKLIVKDSSASGFTSNHGYFISASNTSEIIASNCNAGQPRINPWFLNSATNGKALLANLASDTAGSTPTGNRLWGKNVRILGVAMEATSLSSSAGVADWAWSLFYANGSNPTTGRIHLMMNEQLELLYYTHSSGVYFNHSGTVYLPAAGEWLIWEIPEPIYSVTGFQNVASTLPSNVTTEYQIAAVGADWPTAWVTVTPTNLSAETVSATAGFRMRFKFTATASTSWSNVFIPVTVDSTYIFPTELSTLQINSVVSGSMVKVSKTSDGTVLYIGSATSIDIEYAGEVRVIIRKGTGSPAYKQWDTIVTLVSGETTTITALQELDE